MPCTSYLTGNLPEKMKELGATSLLGKFSSNSYFGSAISIKYGTASSTCSTYNKNFSDDLVTSNAGVGIGVLWLSGITLEDDGGGGGNPIVPPVEEEKLNCTPKYNIGTCIDGDSISYLDASQGVISKEYWDNCVFEDKGEYDIETHKEANKNSAMTYYEPSLGSQYCEVYCIENLTTSFASGDITVEAGSRFMWGYSYATGGRTYLDEPSITGCGDLMRSYLPVTLLVELSVMGGNPIAPYGDRGTYAKTITSNKEAFAKTLAFISERKEEISKNYIAGSR